MGWDLPKRVSSGSIKYSSCQGGGDILCKSKTKTLRYLISILNAWGLNMGIQRWRSSCGIDFFLSSLRSLLSVISRTAFHYQPCQHCTSGRLEEAAQWERRSGFQRRNDSHGVIIKTRFTPNSFSTESWNKMKSQGNEISWIIFQI